VGIRKLHERSHPRDEAAGQLRGSVSRRAISISRCASQVKKLDGRLTSREWSRDRFSAHTASWTGFVRW
jgi:hypothetical protein